jgi:hypothetical protein
MNYTSPKQTKLTLTRSVAATPAEIYDVWLDTKSPGRERVGGEKRRNGCRASRRSSSAHASA